MFRRIMRGRVFGTAGWTILSVAVSAVTGIFTARSLGPAERGSLALVVSIAGICALVGALGTNVAVRRHLPQRQSVNRAGYYRATILLVGPLGIVLLAVVYAVAAYIDPDFGKPAVGIAFAGYGIAYYFSNQALDLLNALGQVRTSAMVNAIGTLLCFGMVVAVALFKPSLALMVWAYTLSVVGQVVISALIVRRVTDRERSRPRGVRILIRDGSRLLGFNVGQSIVYQGDTVMLGALSTRFEVGVYAVAVTPAAVLRIPATALGQVLFHDVASGVATRRTVAKRLSVLFAVLVPTALVIWVLAGWLIALVYGPEYASAVEPFRILLIAEILLSPFIVVGRTLAGVGKTWGASTCGLTGVVLLFAACFVFVPTFGAIGAAVASAVAYGAMSALAVILFFRSPTVATRVVVPNVGAD
ncbi:flippase [Humibacter sp.]|uniref:flippase n=1 Tax=Humibacter sp. TaxID=1940291 RepID=UPI003F805CB8